MGKNFANIETGTVIKAMGIAATIDRVIYSEYWDRFGYDVEFIDTKGNYRHWKQWDDGGEIIKAKKKLVNCYGSDCSDIFARYGYR